jgi:hypothetical protein
MRRWERLAVLSWDRQGMPQTVRALTGGLALREGETEYVRADLHAGGVSALTDVRVYAEALKRSPERRAQRIGADLMGLLASHEWGSSE